MSGTCTTTTAPTVPIAVYYRDQNTVQTRTNWMNKPQHNSLAAASFLFISGGMNMAQGVGWNMLSTLHFQFCWFIGVIIGAIIAAPLITVLPKKMYNFISGILVVVDGIIFVSAPYNYDAIIAARYINGIAIGFLTVPFLVHASEIAVNSFRGSCLSHEQYSIAFGIAIQVIYASQWDYGNDFPTNRLHGIFDLLFGLLGLSSTFFLIESPIFYLRKNNETAALECLRRLQRPQIVTNATGAILEEHKQYVLEQETHTFVDSLLLGLLPLFKMCLYRGMVALTFSLPLSGAIEVASTVSLSYVDNWVVIVYPLLRLLGAFIMFWLLDALGHKLISQLALLCTAGLLIGVSVIFSDTSNVFSSYQMSIACTLLLLYQFFGGMFVPSSSVYLGEAFPLLAKPCLIACALVVENLVHIIIICTFSLSMNGIYIFTLVVCVISFVLCIYFIISMPETRKTSLKEAQDRFRRMLYLQTY